MRKQRTEHIRKKTESFSIAGLLSTFILIWLALLPGVCLGAEYYVYNGTVNGDGSQVSPFTLAQAQTYANNNPDTEIIFLLASGNYDNFINSNARTDWATWKADTGATPIFESITIGSGAAINVYLKFDSIEVNKTSGSGNMVRINNANNIEFHDGQWRGYDRYQDIQPLISGNDIVIDRIEIFYEQNQVYSLPPPSKVDGLQISGNNFTVKNCHIHDFSSSAIQINSGSGLIENCHIHNQHIKWPGFREGIDEPRHGAGIALVDINNLTIRNNIIHACGASGGHIFFYNPSVDNIVIENNLLYDGKGIAMQSDASWGRNGKFNNNIVVTNWQSSTPSTSPQRYQRGVSFRFDSYANDFEFYNNIIIAYMETDGTNINGESDNNIVYSFKPTLEWIGDPLWVNTGLGPNSIILNSQVPGYGWMWKDILEGGGWDPEADFFVAPDFTPWQDNSAYSWSGIVSDFNIKSSSPAIGFADPDYAPATDILGVSRDAYPDAGCYEYVASTFLYGDVNGNGEVTSYDAALAARYAVGLEVFTDEQRQRADVSGNGAVSAYDAALIAQRAVGLIDRFPLEE